MNGAHGAAGPCVHAPVGAEPLSVHARASPGNAIICSVVPLFMLIFFATILTF